MSLFVPYGNEFTWRASNVLNTQPAANFGVTVTPGAAPTFGAYVQLLSAAAVTQDVYGILINFNSANTSNAIRSILADIGVDNAGGTNYVTKIPFLLAGQANTYNTPGSGIWYYFPLYIPSGSSIAVRATGTQVTTFRCNVTVFGRPKRPDAVQAGTYVTAFGTDATANARGTAITIGTTAEGGWQQVGTALTRPHWWWQLGYASSTNAINATGIHFDLGVGTGTNRKVIIENQTWTTTTGEIITCIPYLNGYGEAAVGDIVYIRGQQVGTANATSTVIGYGLGG